MAPPTDGPAAPQRYRRHPWYVWRWLVVILLIAVARWWLGAPRDEAPVVREGIHAVSHVIDGDTLVLESGATIRLLGIDTPETVHPDLPLQPWGPEATDYTRQFVAVARGRVRITLGKERLDRYGRYLGYVWNESRLLNEELVYHGLAETRPGYPQSDTIKRRLKKALADAQRSRRGLWSEQRSSSSSPDSTATATASLPSS
jgi:micrococcal nuclease